MILPAFALVAVAAGAILYARLARAHDERRLWRAAIAIGLIVGVIRGVLAPLGWYVVEHTGGPLQIPAFLLAMLAWPEGAVFRGHRGPASVGFLIALGAWLLATSVAVVSAAALGIRLVRGAKTPRPALR